jgi:hypothetical protein
MMPRMKTFELVAGLVVIGVVLWDAFETVVLPRRVTRRFRLARLFYRFTWRPWRRIAGWLSPRRRDAYLGFYGPLSLLFLLAFWAVGLVLGFALVHWSISPAWAPRPGFLEEMYFSGSTFFTIGLSTLGTATPWAKFLTVVEAGTGFAFLALVIGYVPVIYQAFSRREVAVSLLDARAGSPPSAGELLRRHGYEGGGEALRELLHEWERWSAELLESHLSYPLLAYFRSQHSNQSWVAALTTILDSSAIVMVGIECACRHQAELTFAIARHAVVDLAQVFSTPPRQPGVNRLPEADFAELVRHLEAAKLCMRDPGSGAHRLAELRRLYEPYIAALATYLMLELPPWLPRKRRVDNWQTSAWDSKSQAASPRSHTAAEQDHF